MKKVHRAITDLLLHLIHETSRIGIDSIYFASLGGDNVYFTDEEFAEFIAPYEVEILRETKLLGLTSLLHMCKDKLQIKRYLPYAQHVDIVNWGVAENKISLREGAAIFPEQILMGGLDNNDPDLLTANKEKLRIKIKKILEEVADRRFILGADCTLPTQVENKNLSIFSELLADFH